MDRDLSNGCWLVTVTDNSTSYKKITPKYVELDAALHFLKESMCQAMLKKSSLRPRNVKISRKEQRAWKAYEKIMGDDIPKYFEYPSLSEICDEGCSYIKCVLIENKMDIDRVARRKGMRKRVDENSISDLEV